MAELVEADQGAYAKDLLKKLKKALTSVKNICASGDPGVKESFDEFMIGGYGGSCVEGPMPMDSECTPERFWGEADSWIKTIWNQSSDEEEEAKKTAVRKKSGLDQSPQTETPRASSAKKAGTRTVRAKRPEAAGKGVKGAKGRDGGTAAGPGATAAGPGRKSRLMQENGQPTDFARRGNGMFSGFSALPAGVSREDLPKKPNPHSQPLPPFLKGSAAAGMTVQNEQEVWAGEDDSKEEEGFHPAGIEESDHGEGSNEYSDSDDGEIETRPPLRNRAARGEQHINNRDVCTIARDLGLMFFTVTTEQTVDSLVIGQNWREFRRRALINCIEVIKQVLPDEDCDEYKKMLALIHTVIEAETNAGTRKWRVGVIAAKDLADFQEMMDGHRVNPSEPDGVMTEDRTVWHVEGRPGYELVIRLDQMGQQAGKLLGYFIGADSGMLGIKGGELDKATFLSLQVAKDLAAEGMIEGIEHAQLQFRKATIDFVQGVSVYHVYSAFREGQDRGVEEIMLTQLTMQGCRVRGCQAKDTQFYIADKKDDAITAQREEDARRAPPVAAPLQYSRDGHAGYVMGISPAYFLNPAELVRVFTRCCVFKNLRDDPRFTQIFANAGTGPGFDPTKLQGISCEDEEKAEKELSDAGTLPVYLAAETQSTRGALVAVTILVQDEGAVSEMVRSLLTYSSSGKMLVPVRWLNRIATTNMSRGQGGRALDRGTPLGHQPGQPLRS